MAALIFSRRKICSKVRVTEVVPAPDEPVHAMTGCLADMLVLRRPGSVHFRLEQTPRVEERRAVAALRTLAVITLDQLDFQACAEHDGDPLITRLRLNGEHTLRACARGTAGLLHDVG